MKKKAVAAIIVITVILVIDQVVKIGVKTSMTLHQSIEITDWFYIVFVENNGMAFGMEMGSKLFLSVFRVVAITLIAYYMVRQIRRGATMAYIICLSAIIAGAAGNLIDSMFYGLIFSASSSYYTSYIVPFGTGYAPFLMGKVVDMFYFPIIEWSWPAWMPFLGGDHFVFFSPVFNVADAAITTSIIVLLLFFRKSVIISQEK